MGIKFRGLKADGSNEWVYGYYVQQGVAGYIYTPVYDRPLKQYEVDPRSVTIFTGLTDKNGVDTYKGDRVMGRYMVQRSLDPNAEPEIINFEGVIDYAEGCFYVKADNGQCVFSFTHLDYEFEIIGNIRQSK
jgi:hypothetical protein